MGFFPTMAPCDRYLLVAVEIHVVLLNDTPALGPVAGHEPALVPLLVEPALTVSRAQVLTAHPTVCPKDTQNIKPLMVQRNLYSVKRFSSLHDLRKI